MITEKIQRLADGQGINITILEKRCGLSQGSIMKWKVSSPKCDNLKKIADYFNISVDYLLGREKPEITNNTFYINTADLSDDETELLGYFKKCDQTDQMRILGYAERAAAKEREK